MKRLTIVLATMLVAAGLTTLAAQNTAQLDKLVAAAQHKETVDGDLKGAIAIYEQVITQAGSNRRLAAETLLKMAALHQKLGDGQADGIYQRIVKDYSDEKPAVTVARTRIGAGSLHSTSSGLANRQLWASTNTGIDFWSGGTTPDGRYVSFVDWSTGSLALHDLVTGVDRYLTNKDVPIQSAAGFAGPSAVSRDGRFIAFSWSNRADGMHSIRTLRLSAPLGTSPQTLYSNADVERIEPHDWSPDGKWLALQLTRRDGIRQIGLLSTDDGRLEVLTSIDWRGTRSLKFSPDGRLLAYDLPADSGGPRDVWVITADATRNTAVIQNPAHDGVVGWAPDGSLLFHSDRTGTRALWALAFGNGRPRGAEFLIKDQLQIDASFGVTAAGSLVYGSSIGGPVVKVASIDPETGRTLAAPVPVTEREPVPVQADWSPDGKRLVVRSNGGGLSIMTVDGRQAQPFGLQFASVTQLQWLSDTSIVLRAQDVKGRYGLYRVDASTGAATPIEVGTCRAERCPTGTDLVTLIHSVSPDFTSLYYAVGSASGSGDRVFIQRDLASQRERELLRGRGLFGFRLSPDGRQLTFIEPEPQTGSQALKVLSIESGQIHEVFRPSPGMRLTNLVEWTPDGQRLLFGQSEGNEEVGAIVSVRGGPATRLELRLRTSPQDPYRAVKVHPDGYRLLLTSGPPVSSQIWVLENFLPEVTGKR